MLSNKAILNDTLNIIQDGYYYYNQRRIFLKLSQEDMKHITVILPDEVKQISYKCIKRGNKYSCVCKSDCIGMDSFNAAKRTIEKYNTNNVLVLNFANPINPGGGVRIGAKAQEEDLCRRSTLLCSLESNSAAKYYTYNKSRSDLNKSNTVMITPNVEVFKDEAGELIENSMNLAVISCAAPISKNFKSIEEKNQYDNMFYLRILSLLLCASYYEYDYLILGAWGCGAFGNDAKDVADLFKKAIYMEDLNGLKICRNFKRIDFAVLNNRKNNYNFGCFNNTFSSI